MNQEFGTSNGTVVAGPDENLSHTTSCGRTVLILKNKDGERLEVHAPDGTVETQILFTEHGPVIKMKAVRVEVDTENISMNCGRFSLNAEDGIRMSGKEFRAKTEQDIIMNGAFIRLNCDEEVKPAE